MNPIKRKKGFVMVIVVGVLVFTMIIFASMVNRVRHETSITARTSLSEQLYQAASAIGRVVVRKLQKDIETMDTLSNKEIIDAVFAGQPLKDKSITDQVIKLDVIQAMLKNYSKGSRKMTFDAKYSIEIGAADGGGTIPPETPKFTSSPIEQQGFFTVRVDVTYMGIKKTCLIKRKFFLSHLLAPPFYKFTLFARNGANLKPKAVNRLGKVKSLPTSEVRFDDPDVPLVLFNRRIKRISPDQPGLDFRKFQKGGAGYRLIKDRDTLSQNGWVYLGGTGDSKDIQGVNQGLILNVCSGSNEPISSKFFGEYFHFFYSEESNGWVAPDKWNTWLNNALGQTGNPRVMITYVDFGFMQRMGFPFNGKPLFDGAIDSYARGDTSSEYHFGSALHLFGTPSICTPTLVFGRVKRRFLRTHAFLFNDIGKVYPIRYMGKSYWENNFPMEVASYIIAKGLPLEPNRGFYTNLSTLIPLKLTHDGFMNGNIANSNTLRPFFIETEPYVYGLKNIANPQDPSDPSLSWGTVFAGYEYLQDPEKLQKNYSFQNDKYLHYTGILEDIQELPVKYLSKRTSYFISDGAGPRVGGSPGSRVKLSKCDFLLKKKILMKNNGTFKMYLNQNLRFKQDVEIDVPIEVLKGGCIISDGRIIVNAPLINPWHSQTPNMPDPMGYVTLISRQGIELNLPSPSPGSTKDKFGYSEFHGFLICLNGGSGEIKIPNQKPVHIIGGVAADNIDELVKYGGIVEWGFEPGDLTNGNDFSHPSFFGLAMGPRDIEIVAEGLK